MQLFKLIIKAIFNKFGDRCRIFTYKGTFKFLGNKVSGVFII